MDTPRPTNPYPEIKGHRCPACGGSLFVGEGGYITCSWYRCPSPDYEIVLAGLGERLAAAEREGAEKDALLARADNLLGHASHSGSRCEPPDGRSMESWCSVCSWREDAAAALRAALADLGEGQ